MKMECDIDDVEIPESVLKIFKDWLGEKTYTKEEQEDCLEDILLEFYWNKLDECNGKLVDRELAEFLMLVNQNRIPFDGGYPKYGDANFEVEGRKFTAISFFWDSLEKSEEPYVMVYENEQAQYV